MEISAYKERELKRLEEEKRHREEEQRKKDEFLTTREPTTTIGNKKYKSKVHREGLKKQSVLAQNFFSDRGSETERGNESKGIPIPEQFNPVLDYLSEFVQIGVDNKNIEEISKPDYYKTHALTNQEMAFLDKISAQNMRLLLKAAGFFENVALQNCIYKYYIVKALALPETEDIEKKLAIDIAGLTEEEYNKKIKEDKAGIAVTGKRSQE